MKAPLEYLESARIHDLAEEMRAEGFSVSLGPEMGQNGYDLVAEKAGRRIAVDVKAQSRLKEAAPQINRHRRQAREHGFDEFRLVVVNPPHEKQIQVESIGENLAHYLRENLPAELDALSSNTFVNDVEDVEIDTIEVTSKGILVQGSALVATTLEYGGGSDRDGMEWESDFPFKFRVAINLDDLSIDNADIGVDVSSFYE